MRDMKAAGSEVVNQTSVASNVVLKGSTCIAQRTESPLFLVTLTV